MPSPITPALLQAFFVQQEMRYQNAYAAYISYWDRFAMLMPSSTETNIYSWLAQMPKMREWVGEKVLNNVRARAYPLINKPFENTYVVDRDKLADDQAGIYSRHPEIQAVVVARWPEDLVTTALLAGTTAVGYDGAPFFSANHPVDIDDPSLGTYSNLRTTAALTQNTYAAAKAAMRAYRGEGNVSLQIMPTVLMVPPSLEQMGKQIVNAQNIGQVVKNVAGTENVAASAPTNVFVGDTTLIVNERLIDDPTPDSWYMFSTDRISPFVFQQRQAPHRIPIIDPTHPLVWNQRQYAFSVEARGNAGYTLPFLAIKNTP